jgi:hypothetical protein
MILAGFSFCESILVPLFSIPLHGLTPFAGPLVTDRWPLPLLPLAYRCKMLWFISASKAG